MLGKFHGEFHDVVMVTDEFHDELHGVVKICIFIFFLDQSISAHQPIQKDIKNEIDQKKNCMWDINVIGKKK